MATAPVSPASPTRVEHEPPRLKATWQKYGAPVLVLLLATAVIVTLTRNWNAWEGSASEQVTNDAFVRGDLTPLSTKVPGLVREVNVGDYQQVHKGNVLIQLEFKIDEKQHAKEVARSAYFPLVRNDSALAHVTDTQFIAIPAGGLGIVAGSPIPPQPFILNQRGQTFATSATGLAQTLTPL